MSPFSNTLLPHAPTPKNLNRIRNFSVRIHTAQIGGGAY